MTACFIYFYYITMNMKIRKEDIKKFPAEMQEKIWKKK